MASGTISSTVPTAGIALTEERAVVGKVDRVSGRVEVSTCTEVVEEIVRTTLQGAEFDVTRVPVGRTLEPGEARPGVRTEAGLTVVPMLEEVIFVEKRLVLKEELHIREIATRTEVETPVTLLRQRAVVERTAGDDADRSTQDLED